MPLPPAGNAVRLGGDGLAATERFVASLAPYRVNFFHSGTAALAAAFNAVAASAPVSSPEVLLPAYTCPTLVSAAEYAGMRPVPVDLEPDRPWLDLNRLESRIGPRTVAIAAVHFLGLPERMQELLTVARRHGLALIEDSAQAFPVTPPGTIWRGDYVVLSFGRGKPVSLLGGGALLSRAQDERPAPAAESVDARRPSARSELSFMLKGALYNALRHRKLYWLPTALPFLRLGATRFRPLGGIGPMDRSRYRRLGPNVERYRLHSGSAQCRLQAVVRALPDELAVDLPSACCGDTLPRLLRYPILFRDPQLRDLAYDHLSAAGLGCSSLYPAALPGIPGIGNRVDRGPYPEAERFARSLLTLPTHESVTERDVHDIGEVLASLARNPT